ncbi:MAG: hypothetical protein U0232_20830 [Thermomicrobiales bacterium]
MVAPRPGLANTGYAGQSVATIGGTAPGEGNIIANNALGGFGSGARWPRHIWIPAWRRQRDLVRGNIIRGNGGLGIDLQPGNAVNCAEPTVDGPNAYIHRCLIIRAVSERRRGTGSAARRCSARRRGGDGSGHGEAAAYLGSATVGGCGNVWTLGELDLPPGAVVTATASKLSGASRGTSEFAANVAVGTNLPLIAPVYTPAAGQNVAAGADVDVALGSFAEDCGSGPWAVEVNWDDGTTTSTFQMPVVSATPPGAPVELRRHLLRAR